MQSDVIGNVRFEQYAAQVEARIQNAYGILVVTRDIPDPLTGDLNGSEIHIDCAVTPEERMFLPAHLFGHTVQGNAVPGAFELGGPRQTPVPEGRRTRALPIPTFTPAKRAWRSDGIVI